MRDSVCATFTSSAPIHVCAHGQILVPDQVTGRIDDPTAALLASECQIVEPDGNVPHAPGIAASTAGIPPQDSGGRGTTAGNNGGQHCPGSRPRPPEFLEACGVSGASATAPPRTTTSPT